MTSTTIKSSLHQMIDELDDKKILEAIYNLLKSKIKPKTKPYTITKEELESIDAGIKDIDAGNIYTYKQVRDKIYEIERVETF